jgi:hypothetical protein
LRGDLGQENERCGKAALVFMEMVLGDPGRIEAEPFGVDDLLGRQPVPLGGIRLVEQAREEAQAFGQRRDRHLQALCIIETASEICRTRSAFGPTVPGRWERRSQIVGRTAYRQKPDQGALSRRRTIRRPNPTIPKGGQKCER